MSYYPRPVDTSQVSLDPSLRDLVERLAANNHEVWAQRRFAEGWRYGTTRDGNAKMHPDLVPYEYLPESEKEYDRNSVIETMKMIVALGYSIEKR
jgi:hypothetical protein